MSRKKENRTRPPFRPCVHCGIMFQPARKDIVRFCSKKCQGVATSEHRGNVQRGRGQKKGYVKSGGRHEHRVVAEKMLGRPLIAGEVVHHIDGNKQNNDPVNLEITTQSEHMKRHGIGIPGAPLPWKPWEYRRFR